MFRFVFFLIRLVCFFQRETYIYIFSEINWPVITVNRVSRVRWAMDNNNETVSKNN